MRIAFTAKGTDWDSQIDSRFGRTEFLVIFDEKTEEIKVIDNRDIQNEAHGAGPKTSQLLLEQKVDVLITGNGPGGNAAAVLERGNLEIFIGAGGMTVKESHVKYKNGDLAKF